jgi:hypothetical protein
VTLILGIKCQDGVVLGADGAATLAALGQQTVRQPTRKLDILSDRVVLGVSGPVGLQQRFSHEVKNLWENKAFVGVAPTAAMTKITEALRKHILSEMQAAAVSLPVIGVGVAQQSAASQTIVALPIAKLPCLFQFDQQGSPEEATEQLPFISIGLGRWIADPFLAVIRRIFWKGALPTINAGIFAALWALDHAIKVSPGGISDPKQIVVLQRMDDDWRARDLPEQEADEHLRAIESAEKHLAEFPRGTVAQEPEPPPKP